MSHMILRDILATVTSCGWFSLVVDELCDVSISLRIVGNLQPQELFLMGYELSKIINGGITNFGMSFIDLREVWKIFYKSRNHSWNLGLQYYVKNIPLLCDTLQTTENIVVLATVIFQNKGSLLQNLYSSNLELLAHLDLDPNTTLGSTTGGLCEQLEKGSMYFTLLIYCQIFHVTEKLSFFLQKPTSVSAVRESIQLVIGNLRSMRTEENFKKVKLPEVLFPFS
ncbi:hypothetical protein PR048_011204 [Dryococelus australis]|uniref:Uncharacterized protein n=1 Tax=Dryococelus australis TaxID=614101 RepID=A0ABQ9HM81_9NEOP|nr:hypothetical protein PR048_011204 [Dryococelus australis]